MKKYLENLIARKQQFITEAREKVRKSEDINEVRTLGDQIEAAQQEIEEARAQLAEVVANLDKMKGDEGGADEAAADEEEEQEEEQQRARNFRPGSETRSFKLDGAQTRATAEKRAKTFAATGRQSVTAEETRATLVSGGKVATPTEVGGINDAFNQVSSIIDLVNVVNCEGMGAYKVAYEIESATAATQTEGEEVNVSDMKYDFVEIVPQTEAVVSYISKQVRKQSPLNYTEKVRNSSLTALRKRAAAIVTKSTINSALVEKVEINMIDETTLRKLALMYGGAEAVEGSAYLQLCKADLIAFGDVRGDNEKKAVYEITPDASNPNTGIIKDGGLAVPYILNSNLGECELIYGNPRCYDLGLFSGYEIAVSEDHAITKLMLTVVGDAELGGAVVVNKGFIVTAPAGDA